jgi:small-conductance mechanosensitive channel
MASRHGVTYQTGCSPYLTLGNFAITPAFLVKAFLYLVLLSGITGYSRRLIERLLDGTPLEAGVKFTFARGASYVVFTLVLVVGLQSLGINLNSLAFFGGALGVGLGLGMQSIAKNFVSGMILLFERPIKIGDRMQLGELQGDVVSIGARGTWVRTNDNIMIVVPNSEFTENRVINWTANDRQVRISAPLGVSYGSDPLKVREVLLDVAQHNPDVLSAPSPDVILTGFGDSTLDFELRFWTERRVQTPKIICSDVYFEVFRAFKEHGIEIPFPQRDLHIRSVHPAMPLTESAG